MRVVLKHQIEYLHPDMTCLVTRSGMEAYTYRHLLTLKVDYIYRNNGYNRTFWYHTIVWFLFGDKQTSVSLSRLNFHYRAEQGRPKILSDFWWSENLTSSRCPSFVPSVQGSEDVMILRQTTNRDNLVKTKITRNLIMIWFLPDWRIPIIHEQDSFVGQRVQW